MIDFVRSLLTALPLVGALLLVAAVNAPRSHRARQILMPMVAVAYGAAALVVLYRFNTWVDGVVETVIRFLPFVGGLYSTTWLYIVESTLVIALFIAVKRAARVLLRVWSGTDDEPAGSGRGEGLISTIYEFEKSYSLWFVRPRLAGLRMFMRVLYGTSIAITVVIVQQAMLHPHWPGFFSIAYPAIAALVVGEFFFAIDGYTRGEFVRDILGEDDDAQRIVNLAALRRVLLETFGSRALANGVDLSSLDAVDSFRRLEELEHSAEEAERIAGTYFARVKQAGTEIDTNLLEASVSLMRGSSVVINNPFYLDLTHYLSFPAYYHLLQYRKCLVIAGRDASTADLTDWLRRGLESITGLPDLWKVDVLTEHDRDDIDVGVLRSADLHNLELVRSNDEFLSQVQFVILAEPSRMLATGQLGLGLVLSRCGARGTPVFAVFDRNHDGLVDALSHLLKTNLTEVVASAMPHGSSSEIVWKAEGPHMHAPILPSVTRYLGVGTEIAAIALKHQVSEVQWVGADKFPVDDMAWIAGQYYTQINAFADLELSQSALAEAIVPHANPWNVAQRPSRFMVVEDEFSNAFESIRLYATRAERAGFVNLISSDYLLRDYMVANQDIFAVDPKAIPSIVPDFARTERNTVLRLVLDLLTFDVPETLIEKEFEFAGIGAAVPGTGVVDTEPPLVTTLRALIVKYLGVADVVITRSSRLDDSDAGTVRPFYRIAPGSLLETAVEALRPAYFFVEDEVEQTHYIGSLLYGHVYQTLLPGQFVTYAGKYYEVRSIGTSAFRDGVVLRRAAEHIRDRRVYRQLRTFRLADVRQAETIGARMTIGDIEVVRHFASTDVTSHGYLELPSRSAVAEGHRVDVSGVPVRSYTDKALLEIRLPGVPATVRRTVALLLNELFVTIFPHSHQYVVALTSDPERTFGDLLEGVELEDDSESIFIVEDSLIDLGLLVSVERNWRRLLETMTDYLRWHLTPPPEATVDVAADFVPEFPDEPVSRPPTPKGLARVRAWLRAVAERVRGWFRRKPKPEVDGSGTVEAVEAVEKVEEAEPVEPVADDPDVEPQAAEVLDEVEPVESEAPVEPEEPVNGPESTAPVDPDVSEGTEPEITEAVDEPGDASNEEDGRG